MTAIKIISSFSLRFIFDARRHCCADIQKAVNKSDTQKKNFALRQRSITEHYERALINIKLTTKEMPRARSL
jgi:hypothetical protein